MFGFKTFKRKDVELIDKGMTVDIIVKKKGFLGLSTKETTYNDIPRVAVRFDKDTVRFIEGISPTLPIPIPPFQSTAKERKNIILVKKLTDTVGKFSIVTKTFEEKIKILPPMAGRPIAIRFSDKKSLIKTTVFDNGKKRKIYSKNKTIEWKNENLGFLLGTENEEEAERIAKEMQKEAMEFAKRNLSSSGAGAEILGDVIDKI